METVPPPPAPAPGLLEDASNAANAPGATFRRRLASWPWVRIGIVALAAFSRLYALDLRPPHFDEGVNGWFLDQMQKIGYYRYDPTNYHGPLHFYVLFAFKMLFGRNLWALRLPIVLMGILTVDWLFRFARFFGPRTCAWAALAMTVSPGFLYYQRDAIHETWLVYFLVLLFWGIFGLWQEGKRRYLWAVGLALAGMILTKETYVIHLGCLAAAAALLLLFERAAPSRISVFRPTAADGPPLSPARRLPELPALFSPAAPQLWSGVELAGVIFVSVFLIVFFYSGTGLHFTGLRGLVTAFAPWMHKASVGEGHDKPFYYWLKLLGRNEPWVAFGLLACVRWAGPGTSDWRLRLLAIYAPATLLAYSLIPYKTPWCVLSFAWPFFFVGGAAIAEIHARWNAASIREGTMFVAAVLTTVSAVFAIQLNYGHPTAETGEEYVYVQTFPDVNRIVDPLLRLARSNPRHYQLAGTILCGSTYPLPWLLGDFPNIGYYSDNMRPANFHADFLLVTKTRVAEAEAGLNEPYFRETVRLRSSLDPLNLYLRAALFTQVLPGRTPEFQPAEPAAPLPGHQLMPR